MILSKNAQKLYNDEGFNKSKDINIAWPVCEENAEELEMTIEELQEAMNELCREKKARKNTVAGNTYKKI